MMKYLQKQEIEEKDYPKRKRPFNIREVEYQREMERHDDPLHRNNRPRRLEPMKDVVLHESPYKHRDRPNVVLTREGEHIDKDRYPQYQGGDRHRAIMDGLRSHGEPHRDVDLDIQINMDQRRNVNMDIDDDPLNLKVREENPDFIDNPP